jgi:hypothetical protein
MNSIAKNNNAGDSLASDAKDLTRSRLHDLQNHLHLATMEVELARLEDCKSIDCDKLLRILGAFKLSLQQLRDHLLSTDRKD